MPKDQRTKPAAQSASVIGSPEVGADKRRRNPVDKALQVIETMVASPESAIGVRELASRLGLAPSTLAGILALLEANQWVTADAETRRYRLGTNFLKLVFDANESLPWHIAMRHIARLVEECDETSLLAIFDRARFQCRFVSAVESRQAVRYVADVQGQAAPIYAGASGLAILAVLPDAEIESVLSGPLVAVTEKTFTTRRHIEDELALIRRRGFACTTGQRTPGAVGVAAPINGLGRRVLGSVVLTIPEFRFEPARLDELGHAVVGCARAITAELDTCPTVQDGTLAEGHGLREDMSSRQPDAG